MNFTSNDCKHWGVVEEIFPHMTKECAAAMTETIFGTDRFWADMEIQPKAQQVVKKLIDKGHEVYIVTAPWPTAKNCKSEKEEWIKRFLPSFDLRNIIFCYNKNLLTGDLIIDDAPYNISNNNCKYSIIFDYPYNQDTKATFRAKDWSEIDKIIQSQISS